ncbi:MAG: hypothetical protein AABX73_03415 [Nanoarchaeota archaeon]
MNTNEEIIRKIKSKKELSGITNSIVEEHLSNYIKKRGINLPELREKQLKIIIKEIRAKLRTLSGQYQRGVKHRLKFLNNKELENLLRTHSSTSERIDFYPSLKKMIKNLKIKSILDLGCGLNPIALSDKKIKYYASDIKEDELSLIESYFAQNKINGRTFVYDIRAIKDDLPKADLCLLFKVIDLVSKNNKSLTKNILSNIKCKYILVSFPTKKLSGRPMSKPKRIWFERILAELNMKFETFQSDNEIFYLINTREKSSI